MSRIHEALRQAEEERNRVQPGGESLPAPVLPEMPSAPDIVTAYTAGGGALFASTGVAPAPVISAEDDKPFSMANIKARCAKPAWQPDAKSMLFMKGDASHDLGMEEFRTLRSRLYRIREKRALKTILVGSAVPGEGKSFVSANLAQIMGRQYGRKVLLIDGDLRKSRLHNYLGAPATPGLLDYLRGSADEYQIIQQSPMENLFFVPGGREETNPAELVNNGRLKQLVDRLSAAFDWIIIDSPPVIPVSDATLMSQCVDGILLVIDAGRTPADIAQRARMEFKDRPLLGVVLNRIHTKGFSSYYYGRYGYGYGYGYGAPKKGKKG